MAIILFIVVVIGCSNKELSRKDAANQIKKAMGDLVATATVNEGDFVCVGDDHEYYDKLAKMGFIKASMIEVNSNRLFSFYHTEFLPSFKNYIVKTSTESPVRAPGITGLENESRERCTSNEILVWKINFVSVTGIKENTNRDGCGAEVMFTCKVEKSPFASALRKNIPSDEVTLSACFSKYDDGWRLESFDLPKELANAKMEKQ